VIAVELSPREGSAWDEYVEARGGNCYHARAWQSAAERAYRLRAPFLVARAGGAICGALPLFIVPKLPRRYATTGMFGAYAPLLADSTDAARCLVDGAIEIARAAGATHLTVKLLADEPPREGFVRSDAYAIATLPLAPTADEMWKRVGAKIRNMVRKGEKSSLAPRAGRDQLDACYDVLADNYHRLGTPIYGRRFVRALVDALGPRARVFTLAHDGRVVAGAITIRWGDTLAVPFASARPSALALSPNHLLYWEIVKAAILDGARVLDFGRSKRDSGPLAFKLHWGAQLQAQPLFHYALAGAPPSADGALSPAESLVNRLWPKLPRAVVDLVGPILCRRWLV